MQFILRASPRQGKMFNICLNLEFAVILSVFVSAQRVLTDYFQMQIATLWLSYAHQEAVLLTKKCFMWKRWMHQLVSELCFRSFQQSHHIVVIKQVSHLFILSYVIFVVKAARGISVWKFSLSIKCNHGKHSNWTWEFHFKERPPEAKSKKLKVLYYPLKPFLSQAQLPFPPASLV